MLRQGRELNRRQRVEGGIVGLGLGFVGGGLDGGPLADSLGGLLLGAGRFDSRFLRRRVDEVHDQLPVAVVDPLVADEVFPHHPRRGDDEPQRIPHVFQVLGPEQFAMPRREPAMGHDGIAAVGMGCGYAREDALISAHERVAVGHREEFAAEPPHLFCFPHEHERKLVPATEGSWVAHRGISEKRA